MHNFIASKPFMGNTGECAQGWGPARGSRLVQHTCQALPQNLVELEAGQAKRLCKYSFEAFVPRGRASARCLGGNPSCQKPKLLLRHGRPTPEAKTSSSFLPLSV